MNWRLVLICLYFLSCHYKQDSVRFFANKTQTKIYIQPFSDLPPSYTSYIVSELKKLYPADITLLTVIPLPREAWYEPRKRYRADSLIHWLKNRVSDHDVVIGLTSKDISTTKNEIKDFGVMGLGFTPGKACVVSTFSFEQTKFKTTIF